MKEYILYFISIFIKFFFLQTPFFALTMFLSLTADYREGERKKLALRITLSVFIVCMVLFFFGRYIFMVFGITIDAFRVGTGALLFLTAVSLSRGRHDETHGHRKEDFVVVPLSIPVIAGPATIGTIMILTAEAKGFTASAISLAALSCAILCVGAILYLSSVFERVMGRKGLSVMTKITGLILSALAAQMIFAGIKALLA